MPLRLVFIFLALFAFGSRAWAQNRLPDEITVEPNVVQIILNEEHRQGVDWEAIVSDFHTAQLKKENDPVWNDKKYRLSFGTLSPDDYTVLLDALDMAGQVSQVPQPAMKIDVNKPASISFEKQNIRINLLLTRLKTKELSLRVDCRLAVAATEILDGEKIPASVPLETETKVLVPDDMTIVVGGLMKEEEIKKTHKFPLLGNIPIVGLVFRSRGRLMQKTETVIFLTLRTNAVEEPEDDDSSI